MRVVSTQIIPAYVLNLDRRADRCAHMSAELEAAAISWTRVSAVDAKAVSDEELGQEIQLQDPRIGMGRGSQACAVTNFNIYRRLLASTDRAALIMQDDIAVDAHLRDFLTDLDWLPDTIGLVQFEKFGKPQSTRLAGPRHDCARAGRGLHKMYSRTAGAGCYLITRKTAQLILETKQLLDMPIDHYLFSPNVSPIFRRLGVGFVAPALAVQKMDEIKSDLSADRKLRKASKSRGQRLTRLSQELNRLPSQALAMIGGARMVDFSVPPALLARVSNARD